MHKLLAYLGKLLQKYRWFISIAYFCGLKTGNFHSVMDQKEMKTWLLLFCITLGFSFGVQAQEIPSQMSFAGMNLVLSENCQNLLREQVKALTASPKYFKIKSERAELYFPIVERIFKEEGLPDEFKYLIILESAFIADAVSSSNAVGFWQFKKESAQEVGLRVDAKVDDRKHIVFSTRGAAIYLKRNNQSLNNWIYTLISYNTGLGGVQPLVKPEYQGAYEMRIEGNEHFYLMKYLAYRIAYENEIGKNRETATFLFEYGDVQEKSLEKVASETQVPLEQILAYNKWINHPTIPSDKVYSVILPIHYLEKENFITRFGNKSANYNFEREDVPYAISLPRIPAKNNPTTIETIFLKWNGLEAIKAGSEDDINSIIIKADVRKRRFLRYNDMRRSDQIYAGKVYYLESKNDKADAVFHTVKPGQTLWDIAQQHAIKLKSLKKLNRIREGEAIVPGRILYMKYPRPSDEPIKYSEQPVDPEATTTESQKPITNVKPRLSVKDSLLKIELLAKIPDTSQFLVHSVESGQTLFGVSRQYMGVPIDSLKAWNGFETNRLFEGQKLAVQRKKKKVLPPENTIQPFQSAVVTLPPDPDTSSYFIHQVEEGQTLYAVSKLYKIPLDSLKSWNTLYDNTVKASQKLIVGKKTAPAPKEIILKPTEPNVIWHEVQQGEGLYRISKLYGVSIKEIMEWNQKEEPSISVGEKLKILKK